MPEHQQTQHSEKTESSSHRQATSTKQPPVSNPVAIIQRARINPKSLTHADVVQLQRTIGNRAVGRLLTEIGLIPSTAKQAPPVQMQTVPEEEEQCPSCMQRQEMLEEEKPMQGKMTEPVQLQEIPEEEEPLQGKFESKPEQESCPPCSTTPIQREEENRTGMPDNLKAGVENLSGIDMSDVRVHFNSDKPAGVGALAYTQGTDIHVAPGQEKHLPHEAWHVVQQAQGRVRPTIQFKDMTVNDDEGLEREADEIGGKVKNYEKNGNDSGRMTLKKSNSLRSSELIIQCFPGIDERTHIISFIGNMLQFKQNWGILSEQERLNSIYAVINQELIVQSFPCLITTESISSAAEFRNTLWQICISDKYLNNPAKFDELLSKIYHEARHSEQYFLAARYLAAELNPSGSTAPDMLQKQICSTLKIPEEVALSAVGRPLNLSGSTSQEVRDLAAAKEWKEEFTTTVIQDRYKEVVSKLEQLTSHPTPLDGIQYQLLWGEYMAFSSERDAFQVEGVFNANYGSILAVPPPPPPSTQ